MTARLLRSLAVFGLLLCAAQAHADDVRSAQRDGYGRIVFDWTAPVRYSADVVAGTLIIQFERPITGDVAAVAQALGAYVNAGRLSADKRTASFPLKANVTMRTFTVGQAVVVDLVGPQTQAQAQAPKAPPPQGQVRVPALTPTSIGPTGSTPRPTPAPVVGSGKPVVFRTGDHGDYFRVAFDWPEKTTYKVERRGERVAVIFDTPASIDVAQLNARMPAANRPAAAALEDGKLVITFAQGSQFAVKDFASGDTIAIDLITTPAAAGAAPPEKTAEAAKPAPAPATPPAPVTPRARTGSPAAAALTGTPTEATEVDANGKRVTRAAQNGRDTHAVDPLAARPAEVSITIPWDEPAAAAVFRRAEYLWVVFDRYEQVDVAKIAKDGAPYISFVEQLPFRNNTILRMVTRPDINPSTRRDGLNWILDFRSLPLRPTRSIEVSAQIDRPSPNLFLPVSEAGRTVAVEDPEVGDTLLIVPVIPLSYGVYPARSFSDLDMPVTAQGVVIIPKSDGVRAAASRSGIDIDVDGGMALSKALAQASGALGGGDDKTRNFNIADWQVGRAEDYVRNKQALQNSLGDERPETRQEARFRLARFEFVNGFYPETLGILRVMKSAEPEVENTAGFRALRGAANMMMLRYPEAAEDFNHFSLANDDDARFWLAAARAKTGDPAAQAQTLIQTGAVVRAYPRAVKIPLALIGVESAIAGGDDFGAQGFLDMIRRETPTPNELAAIDYMDGRLNEKLGELQVALQQYRKAENSPSLLYSVLGMRDRMELDHKLGTLSAADLIEGLEKLRYRWRGDSIELGMLLRLADLYSEQNDYGTALRTLKLTTAYFANDPRADEAAEKMRSIFETLYLNGGADKMTPVAAIGLFDEFRSLVPPGEKGDEMIRKFADRLVAVDMLDPAAELLERQIQFRVTGVDRARIGARLALVYLLDRQPQKAIDTLHATETPEASRDLNAQRRRLEARALTDLKKVGEAMALLGTDTTPETKELRAEVYWRAQDWPNAAKALSELVPEADTGSLNDGNARLVLDWATALTLAGDERTLVRVRQRYTGPMADTPYKDAFALITTPRDRGVMDAQTIRQQIQQAEQFKTFMVEYKDMIGQKALSAIN